MFDNLTTISRSNFNIDGRSLKSFCISGPSEAACAYVTASFHRCSRVWRISQYPHINRPSREIERAKCATYIVHDERMKNVRASASLTQAYAIGSRLSNIRTRSLFNTDGEGSLSLRPLWPKKVHLLYTKALSASRKLSYSKPFLITRIDVYIYIKCIRVGIKFVLHARSATGSNITLVSIYIRDSAYLYIRAFLESLLLVSNDNCFFLRQQRVTCSSFCRSVRTSWNFKPNNERRPGRRAKTLLRIILDFPQEAVNNSSGKGRLYPAYSLSGSEGEETNSINNPPPSHRSNTSGRSGGGGGGGYTGHHYSATGSHKRSYQHHHQQREQQQQQQLQLQQSREHPLYHVPNSGAGLSDTPTSGNASDETLTDSELTNLARDSTLLVHNVCWRVI
ncbi:unnamed protein product [Trichogramma brassicae]|uniref:Uncharacterized protein n=1 Tax=Trichogramma brassicae TaxID=86971 RepID=A0A6H5HZT6_9HYME|nr:unnamed protein product [Trichogramma brassicae]